MKPISHNFLQLYCQDLMKQVKQNQSLKHTNTNSTENEDSTNVDVREQSIHCSVTLSWLLSDLCDKLLSVAFLFVRTRMGKKKINSDSPQEYKSFTTKIRIFVHLSNIQSPCKKELWTSKLQWQPESFCTGADFSLLNRILLIHLEKQNAHIAQSWWETGEKTEEEEKPAALLLSKQSKKVKEVIDQWCLISVTSWTNWRKTVKQRRIRESPVSVLNLSYEPSWGTII